MASTTEQPALDAVHWPQSNTADPLASESSAIAGPPHVPRLDLTGVQDDLAVLLESE
eukprot:m.403342 g.403342  ORF g.403342 m.403342 type:complete len:57 (+) comp56463_c0_seq4:1464-1634(+)